MIGIKEGPNYKIRPSIRVSPLNGGTPTGFSFPLNSSGLKAITGGLGNWTSIYSFDETTGAVRDLGSAGANLGVTVAPLAYRVSGPVPGKYCIRFGISNEELAVSSNGTYDLTAATEVAVLCAFKVDNAIGGTTFIWSKAAFSGNGYRIYLEPISGGRLSFDVSDAIPVSATGTIGNNLTTAGWVVCLFTVTRGAVQRARCALESFTPVEVDISAIGSLSVATPFRVGAGIGGTGDQCNRSVAYIAITQTDVPAIRLADANIIRDFKRFTGM